MQTVILAAGEGTRMRPLTATRPKPMLPVAGRPLLAHVLASAVASGASRLVVVVGYEADTIRDHFGDSFAGVPIEYATQRDQRGTADAVATAVPFLDDAPFVVLNGDVLYDDSSLHDLVEAGPAIGTHSVANPSAYGVVETADGTVTGIEEKPAEPRSDLVNAGAYVFPAAAMEWLEVEESDRGELELTDVLERAIEEVDVRAVTFDRWLDVGWPWELLAANEWKLESLERRIDGDVADDATVSGPVVVESGAEIRSGVVIEGPVYVGADVSVGPNAYVRGASAIGAGSHVGHAVEVKNSVFFPGATVGHLSYVGDSVLGAAVNFGAGTTVANLRHDDRPVSMAVKGESVSTGRRKFGVVTGDGVKTGIQTSLNAGVVLGSGVVTMPNETVMGDRWR